MKTKLPVTMAVLVVFAMACSKPAPSPTAPAAFVDTGAKASPTRDPNPTKDPNVQKGYDNNQRENKEKREREKAAEKPKDDKYDVDKQGRTTTRGQPAKPKK